MTITEESVEKNNTEKGSVVIKIERVCVCPVPKSLSCGKQEAFVPQFLGLGPYHHNTSNFTMTDKLKLAAAARMGKHASQISISDVQPFYHQHTFNSYKEDDLLHDITIDGLFLLALLDRKVDAQSEHDSFFLTGKAGMPLVNSLGVELTIGSIIRDVFMLENQIPTQVLEKINKVNCIDESQSKNLEAKMKTFCQNHCPLVNSEELPEDAEHDHLLDLMYHLVAPPKPSEPDTTTTEKHETPANSKDNTDTTKSPDTVKTAKPDSPDKPESNKDNNNAESPNTEKTSEPVSPGESEGDKDKKKIPDETNKCSFICFNILVFIGVLCVLLWYCLYYLVLIPIFWVLRFLYGILKTLASLFVKLATFCTPMVDDSLDVLPKSHKDKISPFFKRLNDTSETIRRVLFGETDERPPVTIRSVTELHGAGIHFRAATGGIRDFKFYEGTNHFFLPVMKLDENSEVIMRNLMAYESLTRPTYLIFSRYIEIMRAIVDTPEDVKLLVEKKIIKTDYSNKVVADLFNGMSTSIRPTNTPELEIEINKVNAKYERSQWLPTVVVTYVSSSWKILTAVAALSFFVLTAVQTYCSIYACSSRSSSNLGKLPPYSDYGFISSM